VVSQAIVVGMYDLFSSRRFFPGGAAIVFVLMAFAPLACVADDSATAETSRRVQATHAATAWLVQYMSSEYRPREQIHVTNVDPQVAGLEEMEGWNQYQIKGNIALTYYAGTDSSHPQCDNIVFEARIDYETMKVESLTLDGRRMMVRPY
jgi:hypothetical protein